MGSPSVRASARWLVRSGVPSIRLGIKCHYAREYGRASSFFVAVVCGVCSMKKGEWGMKKVRTTCRELDRATSRKEKTRESGGPRIALGLSAGPTQQVMWQDRSRTTRRNDRQVNWQPSLDGPLGKKNSTQNPLSLFFFFFFHSLLFSVEILCNHFLIQKW